MNDAMVIGANGLRLIAEREGKPRLEARLCEGGRYELSYGCTVWPDGRAVQATDTCTPDEALQLFAYNLTRFEEVVEKLVKVPLNQNQYDALVSLAYNIGDGYGPGEGFEDSTVLRMINFTTPDGAPAPRWDDAADAFGRWIYATKPASKRTPDEPIEWYLSPTGEPCAHKRAMRGLVIRRYAEACLFLSLDWTRARLDEVVSLQTSLAWNDTRNRNEDLVTRRTEFSEVRALASPYPLPEPAAVAITAPPAAIPAPAATVVAPAARPAPVAAKGAGAVVAASKPQAPPAPAGPPTVDVSKYRINNINVENGAKVMETSDRAVAVGLKLTGIGVKTFVERRVIPTWIGSVYFDTVTDPVLVATITLGIVALWGWGHALLVAGRQKRAKHNATATTLVY